MTAPSPPAGDAERARTDRDRLLAEKSLDRLAAFSDAVVAIAITLIMLPLVDRAMEAEDVGEYLTSSVPAFASAALTFFIIAVLWRSHHVRLVHATALTPMAMRLEMVWLATIVFLPVATVFDVIDSGGQSVGIAIYVGTLLLSRIVARLQHNALVRAGLTDLPEEGWVAQWLGSLLLVAVLALVLLIPQVGALWLLILLIEPVGRSILARR
ncbi:TMEM175 family protein [Demequina aestuarii]|uniref:TMEM175 family protein n=1 Tax=Demequina aestuarii TaxID=327095 RepID=UPI000A002027|nr:TMEM175 family protein [Demequina aestuarii]